MIGPLPFQTMKTLEPLDQGPRDLFAVYLIRGSCLPYPQVSDFYLRDDFPCASSV